MKTLTLLLSILLCLFLVDGLFLKRKESMNNGFQSLQPNVNAEQRRQIPKYIMQLYNEFMKNGKSMNLQCIFPKIKRAKRAIKLIFKNNSFQANPKTRWEGDELRMFMTTAKESITASGKPYNVKILDLFSKRLVNEYKFPIDEFGWKTLNISAWRSAQPREDSRGRVGLKIIIVQGKKKLSVNRTGFRKSKDKNEPYFIEFFRQQTKLEIFKPKNKDQLDTDRVRKNILPLVKKEEKKDYYLPFPRYDVERGLGIL